MSLVIVWRCGSRHPAETPEAAKLTHLIVYLITIEAAIRIYYILYYSPCSAYNAKFNFNLNLAR